ncbi:hypothetical protein P1X14_10375 [Sphingomonas sp. AOB5]|uniref:hypothetical protein n=1 Tax=Sphingomonas sp. AOB5 TaxID=3034017 RepID=UPI0023F62BD3|nr:hypothetical protein [Sphingomonas sp. AOB5]MDF7775652.1 hypothetical protein [Sphingomonas sp. AOB5]
MFAPERLLADVRSYAEAGNKQSGGAGDRRTADWIAGRLAGWGYAVERQAFDVPWFEASRCELLVGDLAIALVAQPHPAAKGGVDLTAPLRLADTAERLDGTIAIVRLPYRRWSTLADRAVREPIASALVRGASAIVLVTTGPTGEALLLNVAVDRPVSDRPIALLAPRQAAPVIEAARHGRAATLRLSGNGGMRVAENVIGRLARPARPWLVVSTPRSGWTDCVGERGPGIAIWLALAEWMPRAYPRHSLLFVCNSGHEYENLGASHIVETVGPPTAETDFWLHLGANAATRDYQELPGRLLPLPSADPYRFLMTSPEFVERARAVFKGQPGIEMAYASAEGAAGELAEIIGAGYSRHAGVFGAHRHHHAVTDDLSTIALEPLAAAARGFREFLTAIIPHQR